MGKRFGFALSNAVSCGLSLVFLTNYAVALLCPGSNITLESAVALRATTPAGNLSAGFFEKVTDATNLNECKEQCCNHVTCNAAFLFEKSCFLVRCASEEACSPLKRTEDKFNNSFLVHMRPVAATRLTSSDSYASGGAANLYAAAGSYSTRRECDTGERNCSDKEICLPMEIGDTRGVCTCVEDFIWDASSDACISSVENVPTTLSFSEYASSAAGGRPCVYGIGTDCRQGEHCVAKNNRARSGVCFCNEGLVRDSATQRCVLQDQVLSTTVGSGNQVQSTSTEVPPTNKPAESGQTTTSNRTTPDTTTVPPKRHLVVSAGENRNVQLPENELTLSAYALPKEMPGETYNYEWTLVAHPAHDETAAIGDKKASTVKLTGLQEGEYVFRVSVSGNQSYGDANVTVTVLRAKRLNQPPRAAIIPASQTVKLPTTDAILDGSSSSDDDKIVTYHWEQTMAPMEYHYKFSDSAATLQLKNLVQGSYRFKLTVVDSDGATNSTIANITVIKEVDYPPTANAGPDVIVYMPQTSVTLNGSLSSDDKGIESWEWTKGADTNAAVDMQNTREPYLHLSNLAQGVYTFVLKVTDTAGQSSTAEVHVFVKPENNAPPVAKAGADQEITLPVDWVWLDGQASKDDVQLTKWLWTQVSGPNTAKLESADKTKAKATGLTKGVYVFQLAVWDAKGLTATDTVAVVVKQTDNIPPKAASGGDRTVTLPLTMVALNGTASKDDLGIVRYAWVRQPGSLAAGEIIENSDQTAVLKLINLIPGRYVFKLTVWDGQGASDSDTASLIVKDDDHRLDLVEMTINADINRFSEEQKVTLAKKLALLLHGQGDTKVNITRVASARNSDRVILVFTVVKRLSDKTEVVEGGPAVVAALKDRLGTDGSLLDFDILSLDTVVCQNSCSGHGTCDPLSKRCVCEAFWMASLTRLYLTDRESNCDWSILYVAVVLLLLVVGGACSIWLSICLHRRCKTRKPKKRHRYSLLEENCTDKEAMKMLPVKGKNKNQTSSLMISESDSDSEVAMFEKRNGTVAPAGVQTQKLLHGCSNGGYEKHRSANSGSTTSSVTTGPEVKISGGPLNGYVKHPNGINHKSLRKVRT